MMDPSTGRRTLVAGCLVGLLALAACSSDRSSLTPPPIEDDGRGRAAAEAAPPTTTPIETVAMVGDSITLGSAPELEEMFTARGLEVIAIDAQEGRRMVESSGDLRSGLEATSALAAGPSPDLWVIALGTNDVGQYDPAGYALVINALLNELPSTDTPLVWVDVYNGNTVEATRELNTVLNDIVRRRRGAVVAPWSAVAGRDGIVYDQVHPSEEGRDVFAAVVGDAVSTITG